MQHKKCCCCFGVVFVSDKNTFCLLTNGFQLFLKFLCVSPTSFSYFFLLWGQFDVYWYILEVGGFCPFMLIFIVVEGGGKCPVGSYTRIPWAGWTGCPFSLLPFLFSFFTLLLSLRFTKIIKRLHILLCAFLTWISYKNCKQGLKSGTPYIDIVLLFSGGK